MAAAASQELLNWSSLQRQLAESHCAKSVPDLKVCRIGAPRTLGSVTNPREEIHSLKRFLDLAAELLRPQVFSSKI